jgi:hypothetical protein
LKTTASKFGKLSTARADLALRAAVMAASCLAA